MAEPVCPNCGYSTRGLTGLTCPECGARIDQEPAPPPRWLRALWALVLILASLPIVYVSTMLPNVPQWWGPLPALIIIPAFMFGIPAIYVAGLVLASLLAIPILAGGSRMRVWLYAPTTLLLVLSWAWYFNGIQYGLTYQSHNYVIACGLAHGAFTVLLLGLWLWARRQPRNFIACAAFLSTSCVWTLWYAFPYLGELP